MGSSTRSPSARRAAASPCSTAPPRPTSFSPGLAGPAEATQPLADQIAAGFVTSLRIAAEHPLLARLARVEADTVLEALNGGVFAAAVAFLAERLRPVVAPADVETVAELLARIACSFVLVPGSRLPLDDDERLRQVARAHLAPLLGTSS